MVNIFLLAGTEKRDIELPKSVAHRSVDQTIILIGGSAREVTDEEWAFIQEKHADMLPNIRVLPQPRKPADEPAAT